MKDFLKKATFEMAVFAVRFAVLALLAFFAGWAAAAFLLFEPVNPFGRDTTGEYVRSFALVVGFFGAVPWQIAEFWESIASKKRRASGARR